jgi:hypothetical protein
MPTKSTIARRDFLLLRPNIAAPFAELSCERLYMRYLDSQMDGSTATLFANLRDDLRTIQTLRLTDTVWLSCAELKEQLDAALRDTGVTVPGTV